MRIRRRVILAILFIAVIISCNSGSEADRQNVLEAVKKYNGMQRRAYMEANINLIVGVATENQMKKIFPVIQALRAEGSFMMTDQKTFIVGKVSVKGSKAYAETEETWVFWWQDKDTREITKPEETITYTIRYNLVIEDGSWKVDSIEDRE